MQGEQCCWTSRSKQTQKHITESAVELEAIHHGLTRTVAELSREGARIWILGQVPEQDGDPNKALLRTYLFGQEEPVGVSLQEHLTRQSAINQLFLSFAPNRVTFLDPAQFCFDAIGQSIVYDSEGSCYWDDDHLSTHGAETLLRELLAPVFGEIKRTLLDLRD